MSITLHLGMDGSRLNSTFQWKLFDELNEKEDTVFLKLGMCCLHKVHKWYKTPLKKLKSVNLLQWRFFIFSNFQVQDEKTT